METLNLQTLVSGTAQALMQASASDYYQRVFKTLGRQLLIYADIHETDRFSMDFGVQFLEDHYHMSERIVDKNGPSSIAAASTSSLITKEPAIYLLGMAFAFPTIQKGGLWLMDTEIKNAVSATDQDAQYDDKAKRLLGNI